MSTQSISINAPDVSEVNLISELFSEILTRSFPMFPKEARDSYASPWVPEVLARRVENKTDLLQVACVEDKPVGLVSGTRPEGGVGTIIWLLVNEGYRNRKIGESLLHTACDYYRNLNCHKLKLTAPSERARDFYLKQGMVVEGFHPGHWWNLDFWAMGLGL